MKNIIYKGAINALSFGNVSYNLLREMYREQIQVSFFPIGENLNFESFDKIDEDFKKWIISKWIRKQDIKASNTFFISRN